MGDWTYLNRHPLNLVYHCVYAFVHVCMYVVCVSEHASVCIYAGVRGRGVVLQCVSMCACAYVLVYVCVTECSLESGDNSSQFSPLPLMWVLGIELRFSSSLTHQASPQVLVLLFSPFSFLHGPEFTTHTLMHTHTNTHIHAHSHTCVHTHAHTCTFTYMCTYSHTCTHTHTCAYTHAQTYSHTCTQNKYLGKSIHIFKNLVQIRVLT